MSSESVSRILLYFAFCAFNLSENIISMFTKNYSNFVRPGTSYCEDSSINAIECKPLSGEQAKKEYLDVIKQIKDSSLLGDKRCRYLQREASHPRCRQSLTNISISDKELFLSVQNDDINTLKLALEKCPDNINKLDEYGWSLLMIACQANSIESVKELLKHGIDTTVRDKAGNSAQSLVIKNMNYKLADILLTKSKKQEVKRNTKSNPSKRDQVKDYFCDLCNIKTSNRELHISSTIHNINLSKGKKVPTNYVIPESNRGFQIMVKVGWNKESGLGPDGSGKKYPIKAEQKKDRKGLGHGKRPKSGIIKVDPKTEAVRLKYRRNAASERESSRKMEINFRRQFY